MKHIDISRRFGKIKALCGKQPNGADCFARCVLDDVLRGNVPPGIDCPHCLAQALILEPEQDVPCVYQRACSPEQWQEFLTVMKSGQPVEIDADMFYYWLEVLPPAWMSERRLVGGKMRKCSFGFAEGYEAITAFWSETTALHPRYFCQRTAEINTH